MNNAVKNVFVFVVGAGLGSAVTYKLVKDKYAQIAQEEIDSVKETFSKRYKDSSDEECAMTEMTQEEYEEMHALTTEGPGAEKKNLIYRKVLGKYDYTKVDPAERQSPPEDQPVFDAHEAPYVISMEGFHEEMNEFDKLTIYYYEDDDTLADEQEEIIDDPDSLVGDALVLFGEQSGDEDIVYVRNERYGSDYEVIRLHKSYQESVLGIVPEKNGRR